MARGGRRTPANPAAVSGPSALSQRTDGGPGQPIRVASGGKYGERKASEQQQAAAPLSAGGNPTPTPSPGGSPGAPPADLGVFGPTQRPAERPTSGNGFTPNRAFPEDPDATLKALYALHPHPDIARLISYQNAP